MTKVCIKCGKEKELSEFYKHKTHKDGFRNDCKKCNNERGKKWKKDNQKKYREENKRWEKNNPEKVRIIKKRWAENNPEKVKESNKKWAKDNTEKVKQNSRNYYNRTKNIIHFKIKSSVSASIRKRLKHRLLNKNKKSTFTFLPYTVDDLVKHLESLFEPWMNWQNYGCKLGCWNIDHIKPDSLFNYQSVDDEEFQKCWALKNLRPLEWMKNIKKSNKYSQNVVLML